MPTAIRLLLLISPALVACQVSDDDGGDTDLTDTDVVDSDGNDRRHPAPLDLSQPATLVFDLPTGDEDCWTFTAAADTFLFLDALTAQCGAFDYTGPQITVFAPPDFNGALASGFDNGPGPCARLVDVSMTAGERVICVTGGRDEVPEVTLHAEAYTSGTLDDQDACRPDSAELVCDAGVGLACLSYETPTDLKCGTQTLLSLSDSCVIDTTAALCGEGLECRSAMCALDAGGTAELASSAFFPMDERVFIEADDVDCYRLDLLADTYIFETADDLATDDFCGAPGGIDDTMLSLQLTNGAILMTDDDGGEGLCSSITQDLAAGAYVICLEARSTNQTIRESVRLVVRAQ